MPSPAPASFGPTELTNGILIDDPHVSDVIVSGSFITGNNSTNTPDAHGIYWSAAPSLQQFSITGNLIGNTIDSGGHQKYGLRFDIGLNGVLAGNSFNANETGPMLVKSQSATFQSLNNSPLLTGPLNLFSARTGQAALVVHGMDTATEAIRSVPSSNDQTRQAIEIMNAAQCADIASWNWDGTLHPTNVQATGFIEAASIMRAKGLAGGGKRPVCIDNEGTFYARSNTPGGVPCP